jgi:hypothetical protein
MDSLCLFFYEWYIRCPYNFKRKMMNSGMEEWTPDGSEFYAANPSLSIYLPGRWRVDAATGAVMTLLPGDAGEGIYNTPMSPSSPQMVSFTISLHR